ncbi:Rrf2 family transcriptional regulator [Stieleria varia]|uniref:HTH-type transcriptional regulator CymR n=1 Tax=Stieleria varia TaxID=2528005 RepID=A0A5C6B3D7_9BACT|nr:Rrf2 family transcriptional regulator [Stieleria varia]TWU05889.1 HTH-type transcriptional regulator CymR [Stieleria varia]
MLISARVHYASLAMIELAANRSRKAPVTAGEITDRQGIPGPFLVQILRTLRSAGWVRSTRGSNGGYRLAVEPEDVTLLDIVDAVGCQDAACQTESKPTPADEALRVAWDEATEASRSVLAKTRLIDLVQASNRDDAVMFYI